LFRVSEEKEVTKKRLKAEQESFEKKIRQLEEQNELIIKEREVYFSLNVDASPMQQQYRECQELLSLYQKYLAEQQEKLSLSVSVLSAAKDKEQKVSNKKSSCQQPSLELDGSYLGTRGPQTHYKNSPTQVALSQSCRNNHDYGTEIHYKYQECPVGEECPVENGLHRKYNNTLSPAKQRSPHQAKPAQEVDEKANDFQRTCPQQVSHSCACRHVGFSGTMQDNHHVSQALRRHSMPVHKTCDYSGHPRVFGMNDSMDLGPEETEWAKRLYEEGRQKLLLKKMELEIEKERLQHLLAKQEANLFLKQQQLQQSSVDYNRFRGHEPGLEDVPIDKAPGEVALMMNGNSMGLSEPVLKHEDYLQKTPPVSKTSRTPQSGGGSSSGKKMVGFGATMEDEQTLPMQTKREGTNSRKGTTSGPRKDAATSPLLIGRSKELATTATSPVQHDTSR
ncbi:K1328 protein, partial [Upupa epops]|nr:K1328 protein [Upupa epops]